MKNKRPRTNRRRCPNFYRSPETQGAMDKLRQAGDSGDASSLKKAIEFRNQQVRNLTARFRAWIDLRTGQLEKLREACHRGDMSAAERHLGLLDGFDRASEDTKRKARKAFTLQFGI